MKLPKKYLSNTPLLALIAANVIPLFGAVFSDWQAFNIVLLYWSENLAAGFYNILKIAFAKVPHPGAHLGKLFLIPFFTVHYGGFTGIHGVFVLVMFKKDDRLFSSHDPLWPNLCNAHRDNRGGFSDNGAGLAAGSIDCISSVENRYRHQTTPLGT